MYIIVDARKLGTKKAEIQNNGGKKMKKQTLDQNTLNLYTSWMRNEERCQATVDKYVSEIRAFAQWLDDRPLDKEIVLKWKAYLVSEGLKPVTVNSKLAALNGFLRFIGREDCRMKFLKIQKQLFREKEKELST